jgi:hypothetical protein
MNCAVHSDAAATGYCRNCGKALCAQCAREVRGAIYCEGCLAGLLSSPQPASPGAVHDSRPGTALAIGFIPGLGAVYNGEYVKALIHVLIFASLIAMLNTYIPDSLIAFFVVALICFIFYMPIDAYRVAKARAEGTPEPPSLMIAQGKLPIGALVLIGLGILLLLANFGLLERDWFTKTWPVALIALGVWILYDRARRNS